MKSKKKILEVLGDYSMSSTRRMQAPGNIRAGQSIVGSRASNQSDVDSEDSYEKQNRDSLQKAAVAFLTKNGKILAVSRGADMSNMNMPGGLVEPGEDPQEAAIRELWEETGIKADEIFPVYTRINNGYLVTTYKVPVYHGNLSSSWEGEASWEEKEVLLQGMHGDYFKDMLTSLHGDALSESLRVR